MTINIFTPAIPPSQPLKLSITPRMLSPDFGDGYSAGIPDGINYKLLESTPVTWLDISIDEIDDLQDFLDDNFQAFYYTMPSESTPRKLKAESWGRNLKRGNLHDFSMTVKELP